MPDSNERLQAFANLLGETIESLNFLQESGLRQTQIAEDVWEAFKQPIKVKPLPVSSPPAPLTAVPPPSMAQQSSDTPEHRQSMWELFQSTLSKCMACPHANAKRVLGAGTIFNPKVALINGACMEGEDGLAVGSRLEGDAGVLLEKMFAAIGLTKQDLYITPALKCPVGGKPDAKGMLACAKHLQAEMRLINPKAIVLLGPIAANVLFPRGSNAVAQQAGRWMVFENKIPVVTLHHPMRIILLGEAIAKQLKLENWSALQALRDRLKG